MRKRLDLDAEVAIFSWISRSWSFLYMMTKNLRR